MVDVFTYVGLSNWKSTANDVIAQIDKEKYLLWKNAINYFGIFIAKHMFLWKVVIRVKENGKKQRNIVLFNKSIQSILLLGMCTLGFT